MKHLASLLTFALALSLASPLPLVAGAARHQDKPADVAGKWALAGTYSSGKTQ